RGYFQETHPQELFRECSVYTEMVSVPDQLPGILEIAMRTALARSGVAVIVVPGEVFLHGAGPVTPRAILPAPPVARPDEAHLRRAADILNSARAVTILAGAGCQGAHEQVIGLAGTLKAPVVHAMRGKEFLEYDNPYDVGMTGLLGFSSGYRAMEHCDALLMLGTDFPYRQFYPPPEVPVIQVDIRGEHIGRRVPVEVPLVGTVADTALALTPLLHTKTDSEHLERMRRHYARARARLDRLASEDGNRSPLHPQYVTAVLDQLADDDAVFLADVGTLTVWAARYLRMNGRRRLLGSFTHGSMANALPQAIGVQASQPGRQVITLSGDGGLAMLMGDLLTLRQLQLPVKIVVFNNGALSFVELEMKAVGIVNYGTGLDNPDFAAVARAVGLHGVRVERPDELQDALREALAHDGPALLDVATARQELSMPPKLTAEQIRGFSLYAARTILSGRADDVVELARTNLRALERE
ncbi:MAG TPA: thiamine pyrophosphate-dependent enzyme, partial [Solirubrobacteraceae bacterium]|nr:thiamine pyrophosphate-dependent enzyme [Solirubrobacteraceae bacterium]